MRAYQIIPAQLQPHADVPGHQQVSVRLHPNLVLVDQEERRYFKQQEMRSIERRSKDAALRTGRRPQVVVGHRLVSQTMKDAAPANTT